LSIRLGLALACLLYLVMPAVAQADRLTIMTYNVEKLFDDVDDPRYPNDHETINSAQCLSAKVAAVARVLSRSIAGAALDALAAALPGQARDVPDEGILRCRPDPPAA